MLRLLLVALLAVASPTIARAVSSFTDAGPKTKPEHFAVQVQRVELPNGLVVLLAPESTTSSVLVWTTFRAGTVFEPAGRGGLAHLVEHAMMSGSTPQTDYFRLLEQRRARWFNAFTSFDTMTFGAIVPAEELPLALWIEADRLGSLPPLIDAVQVERHRNIVQQERVSMQVDQPYGLVDERIFSRLFASPHPLHGGIIGAPAELAAVTVDDMRDFIARRLVPANGVLTVVGRFDPAVALPLIREGLGRLPSGHRSQPPALPPLIAASADSKPEPLSREPRVTMAWRFPRLPSDRARALELGARLLPLMVDGAWGMRLFADFFEYEGETGFRLDLRLPYDESPFAVANDAEGFLRMLTHREMPLDFLDTAHRMMDRAALFNLDSLAGRAAVLTQLEILSRGKESVGAACTQHWEIEADVVRDVARVYLSKPKVVVHARPTRPRPPRAERDE